MEKEEKEKGADQEALQLRVGLLEAKAENLLVALVGEEAKGGNARGGPGIGWLLWRGMSRGRGGRREGKGRREIKREEPMREREREEEYIGEEDGEAEENERGG